MKTEEEIREQSETMKIINKIIELLKDEIQLEIRNKEYTPNVDDGINEISCDDKTWFHNAWKLVVVNKNDSYMWDSWGHTDLDYLLKQTLILLQKAKESNSEFYNHLKTFLK